MTNDHLDALLKSAEASKAKDNWREVAAGRELTLYAAANGASLTVSRVTAVKPQGALLEARTAKGVIYVLTLESLYAGSVDEAAEKSRKAGFV